MLTSPASRPFVSVTIAAALIGPAAIVKPATRPVAAKARRVMSLSIVLSLEDFAIAFDGPRRFRFVDPPRDGAGDAIGRDMAEPHRLACARTAERAFRRAHREDDVAVERRMHGTQRAREAVRRHH